MLKVEKSSNLFIGPINIRGREKHTEIRDMIFSPKHENKDIGELKEFKKTLIRSAFREL